MRPYIIEQGPQTELQLICERVNTHIRERVLPFWLSLEDKGRGLTEKITRKIESGEAVSEDDLKALDRFTEDEIPKAMDKKRLGANEEEDIFVTLLLNLKIHDLGNAIIIRLLERLVSYRDSLETYINEKGEPPCFELVSFDYSQEELRPEQLLSRKSDIRKICADTVEQFGKSRPNIKINYPVLKPGEPEEEKVFVNQYPAFTWVVLIELIRNAIDAMPTGGQIDIKVEKKDNQAVVSIIDSGVGIPSENLARVFEHGFTTKTTGTGLGLEQAKRYFEIILSGKLEISSEVGRGTTVTIRLPLSQSK